MNSDFTLLTKTRTLKNVIYPYLESRTGSMKKQQKQTNKPVPTQQTGSATGEYCCFFLVELVSYTFLYNKELVG